MEIHEVEEAANGCESLSVAWYLIVISQTEAKVDVLHAVVVPRLLIGIIGDVRVIPRHIEACQRFVIVGTLHHQHVRGLGLVEAEGRLIALARTEGHQVLELIAAVGLVPYEEQERFLKHSKSGIRILAKLTGRIPERAVRQHLLIHVGKCPRQTQLVRLHRRCEVHLADEFLSLVLVKLNGIALAGLLLGVALTVEELGVIGGLVLLVPPVVTHRRGTLPLVVKLGECTAVILIAYDVDFNANMVLGVVLHAVMKQVAAMTDDVILADTPVPVNATFTVQDVIGEGESGLFLGGGHRSLVVLHDGCRGQRHAVAPHAVDVNVAASVADDDVRHGRREAVVGSIRELTLQHTIEVDADVVGVAFTAILGGNGHVEAAFLCPRQVLIFLRVVVSGQHHSRQRQHLEAPPYTVVTCGAEGEQRLALIHHVTHHKINLPHHTVTSVVATGEVGHRVVLNGQLASGRDTEHPHGGAVIGGINPAVSLPVEALKRRANGITCDGVDDSVAVGIGIRAHGWREHERSPGSRSEARLVLHAEWYGVVQLVTLAVLNEHQRVNPSVIHTVNGQRRRERVLYIGITGERPTGVGIFLFRFRVHKTEHNAHRLTIGCIDRPVEEVDIGPVCQVR